MSNARRHIARVAVLIIDRNQQLDAILPSTVEETEQRVVTMGDLGMLSVLA